MEKRQKNKFAMYRTVSTYLTDNTEIISGNEEFINHNESLSETIKEIKLKEDVRNKATKGKTTDKKVTRKTVTDQALAVAGALHNLAKKSGDQKLMASTKFTISKFKMLRDVELSIELNSIMEKATEKNTEIVKYGISQDYIDSFSENIRIYSYAVGAQDTGIALRKGAFESISGLFENADNLIDSLDRFMEKYKENHEAFYAGYKTARVIKDLGIRHKGENPDQPPASTGMENGDGSNTSAS